MRRIVTALLPAGLYFAICFGVGVLLGPARILVLEPRIGPLAAILAEAPVMVLVMLLAARWVMTETPEAGPAIVGLVALVMLLVTETALSLMLGRPLPLAWPADAAAWVGLALKAAFTLVPSLVAPRG